MPRAPPRAATGRQGSPLEGRKGYWVAIGRPVATCTCGCFLLTRVDLGARAGTLAGLFGAVGYSQGQTADLTSKNFVKFCK